jgi:uncharacterized protein (TIGR00375 family)
MRFAADLHIHSHFSRATSRDMSPECIWKWAQFKGVRVIGSGDFTHPGWLGELREKLEDAGDGLFALKKRFHTCDVPASCRAEVGFLLSAEISCIFSRNGKTRKVHAVVLAPDFAEVERLNKKLSRIGNLSADGRPILGLDVKDLLAMTLDVSPDLLLIPAHAWTPHFSVFGAASGFDSLEECFGDLTPHIHAIETGLSSDPPMNRRLSRLDRITLVSNSDAHSASKIGREANLLDTDVSYSKIVDAIRTRAGFLGTIEFFPEEGKYHLDGHRACGVRLAPEETVRRNYLCPVCSRKPTIGVMHRVEKLADRATGFKPKSSPAFISVVPLSELVSESVDCGVNSKKVKALYFSLLERLGNEFHILLDAPLDAVEQAGSPMIREAISRMRKGLVHISPGYDGEYGKVSLFEEAERREIGNRYDKSNTLDTSLLTKKRYKSNKLAMKISGTDKAIIEMQAEICKTLTNPKRIEILLTLKNEEKSVSELVTALGVSKANVSQHLAVMRHKGILVTRRDGVNIFYRVSNPKVIEACTLMKEVLIEQHAARKKVVAEEQE